jgi:ATP-dependent helicase/nuclease subunit B
MPVSPGAEERYSRELTLVYTACTQPKDYLFVTWPGTSEGGGENQPSFLVERLEAIFPGVTGVENPERTLWNNPSRLMLLALEDGELRERMRKDTILSGWLNRMEEAALWRRGKLSGEMVAALYGKTISMSASRLDRYKSCHFSYYLQYGLRARPRKTAAFDAPEYGTFVHFVLEYVLRAVKEQGGISQVSDEEVQALTGRAVQEYSRIYLGGLEQQSPRFRYLFLRLRHTVALVVQNVTEELRSSAFQPVFFELGFGREKDLPPVELEVEGIRLSISGFVDRVDGWEEEGRLYLRVIDYKTGQKSFDFTEIWHGLGLQMLLYLFALEDGRLLPGVGEVVPAGVLYLPAREAVISGSRDMTQEERQRLVDKELTRKGLILDDPAVIQAMETDTGAGLRFLPLRVSAKTGEIRGSALVSAQRLGRLKQHVEQILSEICLELRSGEITADPFWRGPNRNACLYCQYAAACHFEESLGEDRRRFIPSVNNEAFWAYLEEQEEGGAQDGTTDHP